MEICTFGVCSVFSAFIVGFVHCQSESSLGHSRISTLQSQHSFLVPHSFSCGSIFFVPSSSSWLIVGDQLCAETDVSQSTDGVARSRHWDLELAGIIDPAAVQIDICCCFRTIRQGGHCWWVCHYFGEGLLWCSVAWKTLRSTSFCQPYVIWSPENIVILIFDSTWLGKIHVMAGCRKIVFRVARSTSGMK